MASRDSGTVRPTKRKRVFLAAAVLLLVCVLAAGAVSAEKTICVHTKDEFKYELNRLSGDTTIVVMDEIMLNDFDYPLQDYNLTLTTEMGKNHTISWISGSLSSSMFHVKNGNHLTIIGNGTGTLTLNGKSSGVQNLVTIEDTGYFTLGAGGILANNTATDGGAVYMAGGTFTMEGGTIANNTATNYGGAVYMTGGTFTMEGGTIANNTATSGFGGALYVDGNNNNNNNAVYITLSGGEISNNTATNGGGVFMKGSQTTITLSGTAKISNNKAVSGSVGMLDTGHGGGVHVDDGTFSISDSVIITNNKAEKDGGGVYVHFGGTFEMSGGRITGNTATENGGGVCANTTGTFEMSGGRITGNTATENGGGVCANTTGTFEMSGGTISGNGALYGNGVYVGGTFNLAGDGTVNGVYLPEDKNITVIDSLTGTEPQVTGIIPADRYKDRLVVYLAKVSENYLSQFKLDSSVEKFALKWKQEEPMGLVLVPTHTVSFQAYEGTPVPDTQTVNDGDTVTKPIEPAKDGHTFAGWHEDASFITLWDFDTQVTKDLILHAKWTEKPSPEPPSGGGSSDGNMDNAYRVLFNDGATTLYVVTDLSAGDKLTKPEDPVKDGYTFAGWHKDTACTQPWDFNDGITGDMTLYAKWTPQETVTPTATATATPTVTATATATTTPTGDASPAPTSQPDTNGNSNTNGETTATSGISLPYLIGGILILLLAILLLLILLLRHTVTFLIPTGGELEEYRIKVWHGRYINTEDLPDLIRTAAWYRDPARQERWDFDQDRVKKSIELYLG